MVLVLSDVMRRKNDNVIVIVIIGKFGIRIFVRRLTFVTFEVVVYVGVLGVISLNVGVFAKSFVPVVSSVGYPHVGIELMLVTVVPTAHVANDIFVLVNVSCFACGLDVVSAGGKVPMVLGVEGCNVTISVVAELVKTNVTDSVVIIIGVKSEVFLSCRMSAIGSVPVFGRSRGPYGFVSMLVHIVVCTYGTYTVVVEFVSYYF